MSDTFNMALAGFMRDHYGASITDPGAALPLVLTRAKNQAIQDVADGTIPQDAPDLATLHDYCDANYYGDAFLWDGPLPGDASDAGDEAYVTAFAGFWNAVADGLDEWIRSGGLRGIDQ